MRADSEVPLVGGVTEDLDPLRADGFRVDDEGAERAGRLPDGDFSLVRGDRDVPVRLVDGNRARALVRRVLAERGGAADRLLRPCLRVHDGSLNYLVLYRVEADKLVIVSSRDNCFRVRLVVESPGLSREVSIDDCFGVLVLGHREDFAVGRSDDELLVAGGGIEGLRDSLDTDGVLDALLSLEESGQVDAVDALGFGAGDENAGVIREDAVDESLLEGDGLFSLASLPDKKVSLDVPREEVVYFGGDVAGAQEIFEFSDTALDTSLDLLDLSTIERNKLDRPLADNRARE